MRKMGIVAAVIWVIMFFAGFSLVHDEGPYYTEEELVKLEQLMNEVDE